MKSGWFWGTEYWEEYQQAYWAGKVRPEEYKSSPLADNHHFDTVSEMEMRKEDPGNWRCEHHQSQVIDLTTHQWSDIRKSYHSIIHRALDVYIFRESIGLTRFLYLHHMAFGECRSAKTFEIQQRWLDRGLARLMIASTRHESPLAAALWIVYDYKAYYASGPSIESNIMHAVIWESLVQLKASGITLVDMGQIDGPTPKEKNIGIFKQGFGGEAKDYQIYRRIT